ncbi:putative sulfoacetate transporter SauU [Oxobacter pfennigii]|uniref:Putative sulfoacetate transporter SauU n=1 Tax=Oxobacter pfennigii TaxID=36849 RepID=A0A0P8W4D3_9CLOT|nr:MFS transporter [Oxobacter pfennigii]KPU42554.1 putative sulfoacetate transporter SauU [Oxobacter pfennigii]
MTEVKAVNQSEEKVTWYSWLVAALCMLTYAVSFISRTVWTVAIPTAAPQLGITMTQAGGLMSAYYVGYVASNFFSGYFIDKFGPRKSLSVSSLLTAVFTFLIIFSSNYWVLFFLRVMAGIASGPLFAGGAKMNLGWFTDRRRAVAMGFIMTGPTFGTFISGVAFTPIINTFGWRPAFTWAAVAALVVAVVFQIFAKERGAALAQSGKKEKTAEEKAADMKGALKILLSKEFVLGTIVQFLSVGANQGFNTFTMPFFMNVHGFTLPVAGAIFAAANGVRLFTPTIGGLITDMLKSRRNLAMMSYGLTAVTTAMLVMTKNVSFLWGIMLIRGLVAAFGNNNNVMQTERAKGPYAGTAMGIYNALCQLGSVVYPLLIGFILDATASYTIVIMVVALSFVIQVLCMLPMKETMQKTEAKTA